ncbi:MAG: integrin alpha, partial [Planctomycetota bacterium]
DGVAPWVAGVAATAEVGHFNDEVVVTFSERLHPGDAVDPALFTLESPPGTPIPLDGVDLSWDADRMETTVRFGGDWAWRAPLATDGRALADLHGDAKGDRFGKATIGLPDLDGDGFGDFAVGAHEFDGAAGSKSGAVDLHSGRTGARLLRIEGLAKGDRFGESLAALPDMDGDGVGDLLVGAPKADPAGLDKAGSLFVVSTADGSVLLRVDGFAPREELGEHVAHAGDLDGDQVPDLMVGLPGADAPGMPDVGEVRVFAGVDGSLLHSWFGETHGAKAGTALVGGADFDGDLVDDIAYGADEADPDGRNKAGSVYLRSGADGSLLFRLDGASADDRFGNALALAGDLDGDQRDDLLIGAWYEGSGNRNRAGAAYLVSGTDGSTLAAIEGQAKKDKFGETVDAGHDFDGDGIGDLLIGASGVDPLGDEDQGALFVYSGADQRLIVTLRSTAEDQCLGERARWAGDLDRDGQADILVAFPRADSVVDDDTGVVRLLSGYATHPYQDAGTPLGLTAVATLSLTVGAVRDLASNPLGDGFRQVLVFGDMTPPQVVDATRNLWIDPSGATVDLRFDEAVDLAASVDFGVTASTGGIELERWLLDQGTVLRLRFDAPFGAGVDSLTLGDLLDPAGNLLVAWTGTVDDAVPAPPTLASGSLLLDPNGQPRLELVFTAPVLASDLADAARWTLTAGGTGIDLGDAVLRHDAAASRLTIDLPTVAALTAGASFRLVGEALRDPHGNLTPSLQLDGFVVAESR